MTTIITLKMALRPYGIIEEIAAPGVCTISNKFKSMQSTKYYFQVYCVIFYSRLALRRRWTENLPYSLSNFYRCEQNIDS